MLPRTVNRLGSAAGPCVAQVAGLRRPGDTGIADIEGVPVHAWCDVAPGSWPGNPNGQSATWEPMITVRSAGSPKWSIALDALRAIAMNRFLRQRCIPGASVGVIVIRETK